MNSSTNDDDSHIYSTLNQNGMRSIDVRNNVCYTKTVPASVLARVTRQKVTNASGWVQQNKWTLCAAIVTLVFIFLFLIILSASLAAMFSKQNREITALQDAAESMNIHMNAIIANISLLTEVYMANQIVSRQSISNLKERELMLNNTVQQLINSLEIPGLYQTLPASSCAAILEVLPTSPSGYYWVRSSTGSTLRVYCDMTRTCDRMTGGWTRVAKLNMTDTTNYCPTNLTEEVFSSIRTCSPRTMDATCTSVYYNLDKIEYSHVCGRIKAYQFGSPDSFFMVETGSNTTGSNPLTIDSNYVDGVSLTRGMNPRQHIWTLAAGHCADDCDYFRPPFVSSNFFCDGIVYPNCTDFCNVVLWDGAQCDPENRWFYTHLPQRNSEAIEMRICKDEKGISEQTPIQEIEIFVQ